MPGSRLHHLPLAASAALHGLLIGALAGPARRWKSNSPEGRRRIHRLDRPGAGVRRIAPASQTACHAELSFLVGTQISDADHIADNDRVAQAKTGAVPVHAHRLRLFTEVSTVAINAEHPDGQGVGRRAAFRFRDQRVFAWRILHNHSISTGQAEPATASIAARRFLVMVTQLYWATVAAATDLDERRVTAASISRSSGSSKVPAGEFLRGAARS